MKKKTLLRIISDMSDFLKKDGNVNVEFSIHKDKLIEYFEVLNKLHSPIGNWFACTCRTCEEYHGDGYVHVELKTDNFSEAISKASNLLARTNYKRD